MLYNSITVRLANIDSIAFLSPLYDRFVAAIATIVPATTDNIFIVNVQNDTDVQEKVSPLPVSVSLSISVSLSVSVSVSYICNFTDTLFRYVHIKHYRVCINDLGNCAMTIYTKSDVTVSLFDSLSDDEAKFQFHTGCFIGWFM